jgi:hypothetical protein
MSYSLVAGLLCAAAIVLLAVVLRAIRGGSVARRPGSTEFVRESPAAVRARYPDAHRCRNVVEGRPCAPERITIRTMNFGQHWRTEGIEEVAYRVEVPLAYAEDVVREHVADYVQDSREHPDPDDAYDRALAAAGYPDTARVLATPELRDPLLGFFRYEILGFWLGAGEPDRQPDYVLNTVERIDVREGRVAYTGTARRSGIPVRYQDV